MGEGSNATITSADSIQVEVTTEHRGEQPKTEQYGWEETSNYNIEVTTEHGDNQNKGEGSNAKITSTNNTGVEVNTEHRGEQSRTEEKQAGAELSQAQDS